MVKHGKKSVSRLDALSRCFCSYANERSSSVMPVGSFVPRKTMPSHPNALQEGVLSYPVQPRGILRPWCPLLGLYPPLFRAPPYLPGSTQQWCGLLNLQTWSLTACKNLQLLASLIFPVSFSWAMPCTLLSLSISLFLSSLPAQGSLPSLYQWFFSSPDHGSTSTFPRVALFSPASCAICSLSPQTGSLGAQNDMTFI